MAAVLISCDPESLPPEQYRLILVAFLEERLFDQLEELVMREAASPSEHFGFPVQCHDLLDYDATIGFLIIHYPKHILPIFDEAIFQAQSNLVSNKGLCEKYRGSSGTIKKHCHIRMMSLPPTEYLNNDITSLLQISGTVVRTSSVRMLDQSKEYECQNPHCRHRFTVYADPEQDYMLPQPRSCPSILAGRSGGHIKPCGSTNIREIEGSRVCVDYQELRLQDSFEKLALGSVPRSVTVILEGYWNLHFKPNPYQTITSTTITTTLISSSAHTFPPPPHMPTLTTALNLPSRHTPPYTPFIFHNTPHNTPHHTITPSSHQLIWSTVTIPVK